MNMKAMDDLQPAGLRLVLYANILLWGVQMPFGLPALNVLVTLGACLHLDVLRKRVPLALLMFCLCFAAYSIFTFIAGPCTDGMGKTISSLVVMLVMFLSVHKVAGLALHDRPLLSTGETAWLLAAITVAAAFEYLVRLMSGEAFGELRVGGVFLEPSHLALSSSPLICYLVLCGKPIQKVWSLLAAAMLLVVGFSSTLIVLLLALLGLPYLGRVLRRPQQISGLVVVACLAAAPALFFASSASQDTLMRVTDVVDLRPESNLSSLVYANGWMLLDDYLDSTRGLGLGFNAMGCAPRATTLVTDWLEMQELGDQNYNDGSFLLSKIGSEFGFVGIALFLVFALLSTKQLLGLAKPDPNPTRALCVAWLAIVFVGGILRSGGGYFTGPVLLGLLAFFVLRTNAKARPAQDVQPATVNLSK
jgi:uncharacterized membrane protein